MFIVWAVTGFWHGADWNFIIWGLYYFVLISIERLFLGKLLKHSRVLSRIYTMLAVMCGWILFAITDVRQVGVYFSRLFSWHYSTDYLENIGTVAGLLLTGAILSTPIFHGFYEKHIKSVPVLAVLIIIFWGSVVSLVDAVYNPFLYFRF